ncbi:hypothetical protein [uncultured Draconibacterium sp.]|uniref:hypothetical protein n=1 Tax=uncultured Draconibacterium sp. TaxID=1573823 RepID=UPI0025D569AE|nr:hypothetical protein [uncultured Draconibacterium sp.]
MNKLKPFYIIWIIFGMAIYFSFFQIITLFKEAVLQVAIRQDLNVSVIKYSELIFYGIVWLIILVLSFLVIKNANDIKTDINYKSLKICLLLTIRLGFISGIIRSILENNKIEILEAYFKRNGVWYDDISPNFYADKIYPILLIAVTLLVDFFILTKKLEKNTNANN